MPVIRHQHKLFLVLFHFRVLGKKKCVDRKYATNAYLYARIPINMLILCRPSEKAA